MLRHIRDNEDGQKIQAGTEEKVFQALDGTYSAASQTANVVQPHRSKESRA